MLSYLRFEIPQKPFNSFLLRIPTRLSYIQPSLLFHSHPLYLIVALVYRATGKFTDIAHGCHGSTCLQSLTNKI